MLTLTVQAHDAEAEKLLLWMFEQWPDRSAAEYVRLLKRAADWIGRVEDMPYTDISFAPDLGVRALGTLDLGGVVELRVHSTPQKLEVLPEPHRGTDQTPPAGASS